MTCERVIEWAGKTISSMPTLEQLEAFARLAREDMREQCAKFMDDHSANYAEAIRNLEV